MLNRRLWILASVAIACAPLSGANPAGAVYWPAGDFQGLEHTLAGKMDATKSGSEQILTKPGHGALVFHRERTGEAEIHERFADFLVVRSGEGAFQVGGKIGGAHNIAKEEVRGSTLEGGVTYKVKAGDVLYIPAKVPHRTFVDAGKQLNVLVIKVQ